MRRPELEDRITKTLEAVEKKVRIEDSAIELKADWIDAEKAARRLAGHANAAGGQQIIWIIGADDEQGKIATPTATEKANWIAQVRSRFDDQRMPELVDDVTLQHGSETVIGMLFDTSDVPYVINGPKPGTVTKEVPWRAGTAVRSASHADLLRLLVPIQKVPGLEMLTARINFDTRSGDPQKYDWSLRSVLFFYPRSSDRLSIPFHKCSIRIECDDKPDFRVQFEQLFFDGKGLIRQSSGAVLIEGPGRIELNANGRSTYSAGNAPALLRLNLSLPISEADFQAAILSEVFCQTAGAPVFGWRMRESLIDPNYFS